MATVQRKGFVSERKYLKNKKKENILLKKSLFKENAKKTINFKSK